MPIHFVTSPFHASKRIHDLKWEKKKKEKIYPSPCKWIPISNPTKEFFFFLFLFLNVSSRIDFPSPSSTTPPAVIFYQGWKSFKGSECLLHIEAHRHHHPRRTHTARRLGSQACLPWQQELEHHKHQLREFFCSSILMRRELERW